MTISISDSMDDIPNKKSFVVSAHDINSCTLV